MRGFHSTLQFRRRLIILLALSLGLGLMSLSLPKAKVFAQTSENADKPNRQKQCLQALRRFALVDPKVANKDLGLEELTPLHQGDQKITGETTGADYYVFGTIRKSKLNGRFIEFTYPMTKPVDDQEPQTVQVYPAIQEKTHVVFIDLDRNFSEEWIDINIITPVFEHLFSLTETDEKIQIPIADPTLIEALTDHINLFFDEIQSPYSRARRAVKDPTLPEIEGGQWDSHQDAALVGIPKTELQSLVMRMNEEAGLSAKLLDLLKDHPLGAAIRDSGQWDVSLMLNPMYYEYAEKDEGLESLDKDDPYRMIPAALRYRIVLTPAW